MRFGRQNEGETIILLLLAVISNKIEQIWLFHRAFMSSFCLKDVSNREVATRLWIPVSKHSWGAACSLAACSLGPSCRGMFLNSIFPEVASWFTTTLTVAEGVASLAGQSASIGESFKLAELQFFLPMISEESSPSFKFLGNDQECLLFHDWQVSQNG